VVLPNNITGRGTRSAGRRWSRYSLAGAVLGAVLLGLIALLAGVGGSHGGATHAARSTTSATDHGSSASASPLGAAGGAVAPGAGKTGVPSRSGATHGGGSAPTVVGSSGLPAAVAETPDPEAANSFPAPASVHHAPATAPSAAAAAAVAPGAPSDAEVRRELAQMNAVLKAERQQQLATAQGGGSIGGSGSVTPPPGLPAIVARVIAGANAIAIFPYRFGGGHVSFVDNAYDCSGSVSYALAAGGLLSAPVTSGELTQWGVPGPGRWITVMAKSGHTYMYVDGLRYDTSGRSGIFGSRWQVAARSNAGFVARHWPGL
jgi:hypothetical protein